MQPPYQNNTLQALKRQRALFIWKELMPQGLIALALLTFCLRAHFFFFWWSLIPFGKRLEKKFEELSRLNFKIKRHIAQSGYRIQDEYPPRTVGP